MLRPEGRVRGAGGSGCGSGTRKPSPAFPGRNPAIFKDSSSVSHKRLGEATVVMPICHMWKLRLGVVVLENAPGPCTLSHRVGVVGGGQGQD